MGGRRVLRGESPSRGWRKDQNPGGYPRSSRSTSRLSFPAFAGERSRSIVARRRFFSCVVRAFPDFSGAFPEVLKIARAFIGFFPLPVPGESFST